MTILQINESDTSIPVEMEVEDDGEIVLMQDAVTLGIDATEVPTKLSQLTDDLGSTPVHTHSQYAMAANIPTKLSQLTDDLGGGPVHTHNQYLTENDISGKADKSYVDQKISEVPTFDPTKYTKTEDMASVAISGSYNDLSNKPTIPTVPTNVSAFTNDAGYLTSHQDISGKVNRSELAAVATSGSYNDLSNKPAIPSKISDLTEDSTHRTVTDAEKAAWNAGGSGTNKTKLSEFTDDLGSSPAHTHSQYLTEHQSLTGYATESYVTGAVSGKADSSSLATVATSGSYNDLTDKPEAADATFWATYGTTTFQQITDAVAAGKVIMMYYSNRLYKYAGLNTYHYFEARISTTSNYYARVNTSNTWSSSSATAQTTSNLLKTTSTTAESDANYYSALRTKNALEAVEAEIPTNLSDLTEDSTHRTVTDEEKAAWNAGGGGGTTKTKLSEFTDDLGSSPTHTHSQYLTEHQDISGKANTSDLATVATSGSYNDLSDTPEIPTVPTALSSFTDDLGSSPTHTHSQYLTSHQDVSGKADKQSITEGYAGTSNATSGSTISIPYAGFTSQGVCKGYGTHTHTVTGFSPTAGSSSLTTCSKGTFGDAAIKGVTTSVTSGGTSLITSGAVYTALNTVTVGTMASFHTSLSTTSKSSFTVAKCGKIATLNIYVNSSSSNISANTEIAKLPDGFKPKNTIYPTACIAGTTSAVNMVVTTDGTIKAPNTQYTSKTYWTGTITYITA